MIRLFNSTAIAKVVRRFWRSAVLWGFAVVVLRAIGFTVAMSYALRQLPPADMGFWYVLINLAALACIIELGLSTTIGRFASYFLSGTEFVPALCLDSVSPGGKGPNFPAIAGLIKMAQPLYFKFGVFVTGIMLLGGTLWFALSPSMPAIERGHVQAFVLLAVGSGVGMVGLFWWRLLFGMDRVKTWNKLFVLGLLVQYAVCIIGLSLGWGLTALVAGTVAFYILPRWMSRKTLLTLIPEDSWRAPVHFTWRHFWPMTWRSGIANLGAYLCLQSTTLICAHVTDLETTASYGLTMQIAVMLHEFSATWLSVKYPEISRMRAQKRMQEVRMLVTTRMILTILTYTAGALAAIFIGPPLLRLLGSRTSLLALPQAAAMFGVVALHLFVGMHAAVLRTGNHVPQLRSYLASGLISTVLALVLGVRFGIPGLLAAPVIGQMLLNYVWVPILCWREFRNDNGA